jgi:hypothetical protein
MADRRDVRIEKGRRKRESKRKIMLTSERDYHD